MPSMDFDDRVLCAGGGRKAKREAKFSGDEHDMSSICTTNFAWMGRIKSKVG